MSQTKICNVWREKKIVGSPIYNKNDMERQFEQFAEHDQEQQFTRYGNDDHVSKF